jgi:hypothetical protein
MFYDKSNIYCVLYLFFKIFLNHNLLNKIKNVYGYIDLNDIKFKSPKTYSDGKEFKIYIIAFKLESIHVYFVRA